MTPDRFSIEWRRDGEAHYTFQSVPVREAIHFHRPADMELVIADVRGRRWRQETIGLTRPWGLRREPDPADFPWPTSDLLYDETVLPCYEVPLTDEQASRVVDRHSLRYDWQRAPNEGQPPTHVKVFWAPRTALEPAYLPALFRGDLLWHGGPDVRGSNQSAWSAASDLLRRL